MSNPENITHLALEKRAERIEVRNLPDGRRLWLYPMLFTYRLAIGGPADMAADDSWCYEAKAEGMRAFETWDPASEAEPFGWVKHPPSGRCRPNGDAAREYVND